MIGRLRLALGCVLCLLLAHPAGADIFFTTGALTEIPAPASFVEGALESSSSFVILDEGITVLPGDVLVNAFGVGTTSAGSTASLAVILAGTRVHSYFVHFDPVGGGFATLTGEVFFDPGEFIIGIQTHTPLLNATDPVTGHPTPIYPTGIDAFRAHESLPGIDSVTISPGLLSASFTHFAELGIDQARIFTIPEPATQTLLLLGALVLTRIKRRRRASKKVFQRF
jgi:hypothetical protein